MQDDNNARPAPRPGKPDYREGDRIIGFSTAAEMFAFAWFKRDPKYIPRIYDALNEYVSSLWTRTEDEEPSIGEKLPVILGNGSMVVAEYMGLGKWFAGKARLEEPVEWWIRLPKPGVRVDWQKYEGDDVETDHT